MILKKSWGQGGRPTGPPGSAGAHQRPNTQFQKWFPLAKILHLCLARRWNNRRQHNTKTPETMSRGKPITTHCYFDDLFADKQITWQPLWPLEAVLAIKCLKQLCSALGIAVFRQNAAWITLWSDFLCFWGQTVIWFSSRYFWFWLLEKSFCIGEWTEGVGCLIPLFSRMKTAENLAFLWLWSPEEDSLIGQQKNANLSVSAHLKSWRGFQKQIFFVWT